MNEYYVKVDFTKGRIATNLKKLVQNDYNSTKINFTFDKEGRVLFKMLYPDGTQYVDEILNNSLVFGAGILHQEGDYEYEISLYTEDGRLTDYATKSFEVRSELVNTDELVESDDRVPILDDLINDVNKNINEINNLDIDLKDSILTITRKDGTTYSENVKGEPGIQGKPGSVKTIPVNEFPTENIEEDAIYILPNPKPTSEKDKYLEYVYVNGDWELFGGGSVGVDLTDYPTKDEVNNIIGNLEDLSTEDKSNIVNAINEVFASSGGIPELVNQTLDMTSANNTITPGVYVISGKDTQIKHMQGTYRPITNDTQKSIMIYSKINDGNWLSDVAFILNRNASSNAVLELIIDGAGVKSIILDKVMTTNQMQTITNIHNYTVLPTSSKVPTIDEQFVNKKYVDDAIANSITTVLEGEY